MKINQVNLNIFYGYKCNYSCDGCSSGSNAVDNKNLDPDLSEILESIPLLADNFEISDMITLIGGEPFLYWEDRILPIALEINRHFPGCRINVFSNGQLLGKNIDKVLDLSRRVKNLSLSISRHTDSIMHTVAGRIWQRSIDEFINDPRIVRIHDDHYHVKDNILANIYFYRTETWKSYYRRQTDGTIKPHATKDPERSMEMGCVGKVCACTFGSKLYKCPILAPLKGHLTSIGQVDDPDWKKYLSYEPIDLKNIDHDLMQRYVETYGKPVPECDMCQGDTSQQVEWHNRTYEMIFTRDKIVRKNSVG